MKVTPAHLAIIRRMGADFLAANGHTFADVKLGSDAFTVLHRSGAYRAIGDEYPSGYPDYDDSHFRTALKALMPNAVFSGR